MSRPTRDTLSATGAGAEPSTPDTPGRSRVGHGPLGALPALSPAARRALAASGVLALLNAACLVAQAFLLASVLADVVVGGGAGAGHTGGLAPRLGLLLATVAGRAVLAWAIRVVAARAAAGAKEELRAHVLDHALRLGPEWIARRGPGQLTALTTTGLDALDAYFTRYLPALVTAAVVPLAAGAAVLVADWPSALLIAVTLPLLPLFGALIGSYTRDRVAAASDSVARLSAHVLELVRALPVLAAFRRADAQADTVRRVSDRHRRATLGTLRVAFSSAFALELAATLSVALVAVVIGVRLVHGDMPLAVGLGVLLLAPECFAPLRNVGTAFHASTDGVEAVRRVTDVLAEPAPSDGTLPPRRGDIRVWNLRVHRRGGHAPDGETFTARPGQTVWLRSPSGAGKSTTLAVLLGFVRNDAGDVEVAGVPLAELDPDAWRECIGWVPQSPSFTGGTAAAEIALAAPGLDAAHTHDLLHRLGLDGFADRPVATLSVGQRQRLAVARALARVRAGAWLLLLDEPTAHLDADNARRVQELIDEAARAGCTVIVAAHDRAALSTTHSTDPATEPPDTHEATPLADRRAGSARRIALRRLVDRRFLGGAALGAGSLIAGVALTATSGWLIARASQQPPILMLSVAVVGVRTFGLARAGLNYAERLVTHDAAFRIAAALRVRLWRGLVARGPAAALRHGADHRRLVGDTDTVRDLLPRVLTPPLVVGAVLIAACTAVTIVLPAAGLVLTAAAGVAAIAAPWAALVVERRATTTLAAGRRRLDERILALFGTAAELVAVGAHHRRRRALARLDGRLAAAARRQAWGEGAADAVIAAATGAAAVAGAWLAAGAVAAGTLTPVAAPVVALVPLALAEVLALLPPVAQHWDTLRDARTRLAAAEHDTPDDNTGHSGVGNDVGNEIGQNHAGHSDTDQDDAHQDDAHQDDTARAPHADREPTQRPGSVRLRGADVGWPSSARPVLRDVDLDIPQGTHVAVVGASGAGKSTLLAALLGFLRPVRGEADVPARAAWAPQDPQLVSTTVAENLRLADPHATDAELADALRTAHVDLDLDTVLDSAGAGLSGGQAQRVALARALLAAPGADLVLLDEPTAHLDEPTADRVLADLRTALAGKTVVHVTHRPDDVAGADLVLEVADGRVRTRAATRPRAHAR
ncbi:MULTISPECIES: thiol reductant ABC exporter subunit CydD [Prauserella salsuginis group]|uniref:Thiol reductant ABC exporter subunit CydD n=1 Tax=Prauserella salsuginis TaxID=387889 RepID=A0ABW6FZT0_9PSEU|nr:MULTISPECIES: thiol reductant ABC exporter subunit CydD [Prauserella salsuginis group]MCR3720254.1 ATP-binding cassette, subfamily C, CydCD [Prauserella flava]MCR3734037.1 ATP-binding cassette, subfamily C, CydCD [Prauserella salsuginis]